MTTTTTCLEQVILHSTAGTSNKFYVLQLVQITDAGGVTYGVNGYYGRVGSTLRKQARYHGPSLATAKDDFARQESEKRTGSSAYGTATIPLTGMPSTAPTFSGTSTPPASSAPGAPLATTEKLPFAVMLAKDLDEEDHGAAMADDAQVTQRKYNGERAPLSLTRGRQIIFNRSGNETSMSQATIDSLNLLLASPHFSDERNTIVDCERMGDVLVMYDLMVIAGRDVRALPFLERYTLLEDLLEGQMHFIAPVAWTQAEKAAMWKQANDEGWEGLMFRDQDAPYEGGRSAGIRRRKLWNSATARVLTINTKRSVGVGLLNDKGDEVFAGNVTIPANCELPEDYSLIEVRYLYGTDGGMLYQPVYEGPRDDKDDADLLSSLKKAPPETYTGAGIGAAA